MGFTLTHLILRRFLVPPGRGTVPVWPGLEPLEEGLDGSGASSGPAGEEACRHEGVEGHHVLVWVPRAVARSCSAVRAPEAWVRRKA